MQEINEKEKIKISDINSYENEKTTNTVENNEEKTNKSTTIIITKMKIIKVLKLL